MNSFFIFLRKSFHDIVLPLLFYFLYLASSWSRAIPDSQSFLFTLVNPSRNEPIKINPKPGAAIKCRRDLGPAFGNSTQYDLRVWHPVNGSCIVLGNGFTCPENVNRKTYLAAINPFEISELEIFKVNL